MRVELGPEGRDRVIQAVRNWAAVAGRIEDRVRSTGKVYAPLPPGVSGGMDVGGFGSMAGREDWLWRRLAAERSGRLVVHDCWARPTDGEALGAGPIRRVTEGQAVAFVIAVADLTMPDLQRLLRLPHSFQVCCYLVGDGDDEGLAQVVASTARAVFASAYDQESWVVWEG